MTSLFYCYFYCYFPKFRQKGETSDLCLTTQDLSFSGSCLPQLSPQCHLPIDRAKHFQMVICSLLGLLG